MLSTGKVMTVGLTVPLVAAGGAAVKLAIDAEETASKFKTVLGPATAEVNDRITELMHTIPATRAELQNSVADFTALAKAQGLTSDEAVRLSEKFVVAAADLGSFNNVPTAEALAAIRSGLVGSSEPLLRFGIDTRKASLEAIALEQGLIKEGEAMDESTRAAAVLAAIHADATSAMGDAARTADSTANQLKFLKRDTLELATGIGQQLIPFVQKLVGVLSQVLEQFSKLGPQTQKWLVIAGGAGAAAGPLLIVTGTLVRSVSTLLPLLLKTAPALTATGAAGTTAGAGMNTAAVGVGRLTVALARLAGPLAAVAGAWVLLRAAVQDVEGPGDARHQAIGGGFQGVGNMKESIDAAAASLENAKNKVVEFDSVVAGMSATAGQFSKVVAGGSSVNLEMAAAIKAGEEAAAAAAKALEGAAGATNKATKAGIANEKVVTAQEKANASFAKAVDLALAATERMAAAEETLRDVKRTLNEQYVDMITNLEIERVRLTQGEEAARDMELAIQGYTKAQREAIIELERGNRQLEETEGVLHKVRDAFADMFKKLAGFVGDIFGSGEGSLSSRIGGFAEKLLGMSLPGGAISVAVQAIGSLFGFDLFQAVKNALSKIGGAIGKFFKSLGSVFGIGGHSSLAAKEFELFGQDLEQTIGGTFTDSFQRADAKFKRLSKEWQESIKEIVLQIDEGIIQIGLSDEGVAEDWRAIADAAEKIFKAGGGTSDLERFVNEFAKFGTPLEEQVVDFIEQMDELRDAAAETGGIIGDNWKRITDDIGAATKAMDSSMPSTGVGSPVSVGGGSGSFGSSEIRAFLHIESVFNVDGRELSRTIAEHLVPMMLTEMGLPNS